MCVNSKEDRIALEQMERSVKLVNGHFQLPLLWRDKQTVLPDYRAVAQSRLESLKRRLIRDDQLHQLYAKAMQNYIDHGYAEPVPGDVEVASRRWFLPHHPVTNPNKPGKVRIVFDCASQCKGVSLNVALFGYVSFIFNWQPFFFVDVVNRNWQRISVGFCSWLKQFI